MDGDLPFETMTRREVYACFALAGLLADPSGAGPTEKFAELAFSFADAMLKKGQDLARRDDMQRDDERRHRRAAQAKDRQFAEHQRKGGPKP